ncbi:Sensor histidine kinase regulating citrate/malate metabolism [Rhodococcus rhodochrous J3]|uniref:Sensor-like histidine kinase SenX3 n=2 Tax=Rhodococcus rhodochrous TaxID=1829 RepID=A0AA46WXM6_RHORH|nr:sensor histidine kinase [Rhodococcus rhodochrous]MBF4478804.1 sensor histidine kinase [Rhodococcus rhodochrous]MCB8913660.1 sensor histidine kinase [Rhodococcus rhodochrous]UZF46007.1 sensor histidine kinase [Rhodococcus rhodochrous]SMG39208.1 Sensor histidine kinase regulating citrate/malate metabolism [Rhodococcus rhodochrous J3]
MKLRTQVLLLQSAVVAVALGIGFTVFATTTEDRVTDEHGQRALAIARSVSADPTVRDEVARYSAADDGVVSPDNPELASGAVQQAAEAVRTATGALFVVVTDDQGLRLAHPDPEQLGRRVSTDPTEALAGREVVTSESGTLGDSVRAKVPVTDPASGRVVGEVSVGIATDRVRADLRSDLADAVLIALAALGCGAVGSLLLANRWKRLTLGLEPEQLTELVREQEVVLHGISDGVVGTDARGNVTVVNAEARRLLDLDDRIGRNVGPDDGIGHNVDTLGMTPRLLDVLRSADGIPVAATTGDRVVVAVSRRVVRDGRDLGTVMSVRDRTDIETLTRELDAVKAMSTALRAQRHEFANRLHLLDGLLRRGHADQALEYIEQILGSGPLGEQLEGIDAITDPYLHAFLVAKAAHAREQGVALVLGENTWVHATVRAPVDVTTVLGNLLDNAIEAARTSGRAPAEVEVELMEDGADLHVSVADTGDGVDPELPDIFAEGATTRSDPTVPGGRGMGLALARRIARLHGGDVVLADRGGQRTPENPTGGAVFLATLPGMLDERDTGWAERI